MVPLRIFEYQGTVKVKGRSWSSGEIVETGWREDKKGEIRG